MNAEEVKQLIDATVYENPRMAVTATKVNLVLTEMLNLHVQDAERLRYGSTAYWNSQIGYIPPAGSVIIYSDYKTVNVGGVTKPVAGVKVGSGNAYVQDLAFLDDAEAAKLYTHIINTDIHTTAQEKEFWSNKLNVTDYQEVQNETLIFHRN